MRGRNTEWAERAVREAANLTAEDALLALQSSGDALIVFQDAESGRFSVLHRRDPDHFDLIVPEA